MLIPLNVGQERRIELIKTSCAATARSRWSPAQPEASARRPRTYITVGMLGVVARMIRVPDGTCGFLIQGRQRFRLEQLAGDRALPGGGGRRRARRSQPQGS